MTTITCKISDEVGALLEAAARQRRVPKSQIVREALAARFRKRKPTLSAFDLIKDACGIIKGIDPGCDLFPISLSDCAFYY